MTLNLTELRRDYEPWGDVKSRRICGLCDLVEERDKRIAELEATLTLNMIQVINDELIKNPGSSSLRVYLARLREQSKILNSELSKETDDA